MTRRYVTLSPARAEDWMDDRVALNGQTVHEPERSPRWTGLYDAHGNKLYAVDEREPIGFVRRR